MSDNRNKLNEKKTIKPPALYIREKNSNDLVNALTNLIGKSNFYVVPLKKGNIDETKVQILNETHYRQVVKELEKTSKQFYTYQLKSTKGLTIVIKGIEAGVDTNEILKALEEQNFEAKSVFNILNKNRQPQPLYKVELLPDGKKLKKGEVHPVYLLRYLLNRRITVEEPRKRKDPIQCQNCQEFGHTKAYCKLASICVICANVHSTNQCPENRENATAKKCSNCGGSHTANYRGCPVFTALKNKIKQNGKSLVPQRITENHDIQNQHFPPLAKNTGTNLQNTCHNTHQMSYANIVSQNDQNNSHSSFETIISSFANKIETFMNFMQNMMSNLMQCMMQNHNIITELLKSK